MSSRLWTLCLIAVGPIWSNLVLSATAETVSELLPEFFESDTTANALLRGFSDPIAQLFKRAVIDAPNATHYDQPIEYGGDDPLGIDLSKRGELLERQQTCVNPGYIPCSNRPGYCAQPGYFCCTNGNWACPNGSSCCSTRGCARAGYSCCSNGGTCPTGDSCCDTVCARPGYGCCPGGTRTCPLGGQCCNPSGCAPSGGRCCGSTYCTGSETCCSGQGCASPGATCCGNHQCYAGYKCCGNGVSCAPSDGSCCGNGSCAAGRTCCGGAGCAPVGGTCCGSQGRSCAAGYKCCGGGTSCAPNSATCCGSGYCKEGKKCCQRDGENYCADDCNAQQEENNPTVPIIIFPYLDGFMKEIFDNMCRGIRKRGLAYGAQKDVLTYVGSSVSGSNRRAAGCGTVLKCGGSSQNATYDDRKQCDEYPFASTAEGGAGAQIDCVPWWQNNWQGIYFGSWLKMVRLRSGQQFGVILQGIDCATVPANDPDSSDPPNPPNVHKRQNSGTTVLSGSNANGRWMDPTDFVNLTTNEGRGAFMVPLTELDAGSYAIPFTLGPGNVSAMAVYDDDGEELARKNNTGAHDTLTFTIPYDGMDAVLVAWSNTRDVQLNYTAQRSPLPSTSTTADTSQPTSGAASAAIMQANVASTQLWMLAFVLSLLLFTGFTGEK